MTDFHVEQFDGPPHTCDGRNCAAAGCAMAIAFATNGHPLLTADQVRKESGVSCVPGAHSPSGGLFISDVERVCAKHGVAIDYGRRNGGAPQRWSPAEGLDRLGSGMFGIFLGDYDQLGRYAAPGSSFKGDHSAGAHDYRKSDDTVCWHDPLRDKPIRLPVRVFLAYWQKPASPVRGLAGFVGIKPPPAPPPPPAGLRLYPGARKTSPYPDRTRTDEPDVRVHAAPTIGSAVKATIKVKGTLFVAYQVTTQGESYKGSRHWYGNKAGDRWIHAARLVHEGGST